MVWHKASSNVVIFSLIPRELSDKVTDGHSKIDLKCPKTFLSLKALSKSFVWNLTHFEISLRIFSKFFAYIHPICSTYIFIRSARNVMWTYILYLGKPILNLGKMLNLMKIGSDFYISLLHMSLVERSAAVDGYSL